MVEQIQIEESVSSRKNLTNCTDGLPLCMIVLLVIAFIAYGSVILLHVMDLSWYHLVLPAIALIVYIMAPMIRELWSDLCTKVHNRPANPNASGDNHENENVENASTGEEPPFKRIKNVFTIEKEGFPRTSDPILKTDTTLGSSLVIKNYPKESPV